MSDLAIDRRFRPLEPVRPGAAYRARDLHTAQTVVVHRLPGGEGTAGRAQRLAGLLHPALVALFDVFTADAGAVTVAAEWVPARSLRHALGGQTVHPRRAAELAAEVADGLAELHARGIAHGAVSLDSVVLTDKGRARLSLVCALHDGPASEEGDLASLAGLFGDLSGSTPPVPTSAAVYAAHLRALASPP